MGGSGGGPSYSSTPEDLQETMDRVRRDLEQQELSADINQVLGEALVGYNERDTKAVADKLESVESSLVEKGYDVDRILFGGSVSKHTYVDGLSDVDSLVYLGDAGDASPAQVLSDFAKALKGALPASQIKNTTTGNMAVTVTYKDGTQLQLLPATERGSHTVIPSSDGKDWKSVRPHKFTEKLTQTNRANHGGVVPVIKVAKSLINKFEQPQKLSGYHVEAMAVDAFKSYTGPRDRASMLHHFLQHASRAVLRPSADITGQSLQIDEHLGAANSSSRKAVSRSLRAVHSALTSAPSAGAYREALE